MSVYVTGIRCFVNSPNELPSACERAVNKLSAPKVLKSPETLCGLRVVGVQPCFTPTPLNTLRRLPASAAESLMHICCFPSRCALLCFTKSLIHQPVTLSFIVSIVCSSFVSAVFLCLILSFFCVLCLRPSRLQIYPPLPPTSWHVVGSVGRATLILHSHFSSKTGKSACVCVCVCPFKCAHFTSLFCFFLTVLYAVTCWESVACPPAGLSACPSRVAQCVLSPGDTAVCV